MLNYRGDIYTGSSASVTVRGACTQGYNMFTVDTGSRIRKYTTNSISLVASGGLGAATPTGIAFVTPASVIVSFATNRVEVWDVNTMASAAITTNTNSTQRTYHQQIAGNTNLSLAMLTRQGAAGVTLVSPTCATSIIPSFLSGRTINCIIPRLESNTWLLGTDGGKIYEMTSTGTQITAVHVPSGPIWGSNPSISVTTLAYSPSYLLAVTNLGQVLQYDWGTKTLVNQSLANFSGQATVFPDTVLSNAASGICLMGTGAALSNWRNITEEKFNTTRLTQEWQEPQEINVGLIDAGITPEVNQGWVIFNETNFLQIRIYDMPNLGQVNVSTTIQDPPGVYGSGRIIRIRDSGPGTASVDYDGVIPNVATNIPATDGKNYIELGLIGNTITGLGPYDKWDIRQLEA